MSQKLLIGGFVSLIVAIPLFAFLISQRMNAAQAPLHGYNGTVTATPIATTTPEEAFKKELTLAYGTPTPSPSPTQGDILGLSTYGPTLQFSVSLEGRPANQEQSKIFVGVAEGEIADSPQYLLSYTVDVPNSGTSNSLSLVGLSQGITYTAYLKGPAQLVKAVSFVMTPTGAVLNNNQPITLLSGDLNQDNVVDQNDLSIEQGLLGTTPNSPNWNSIGDFNGDGVINSMDISIIQKNLGQVGDSGKWYSKTDIATQSASLNQTLSIGGTSGLVPSFIPNGNSAGHWVWVPDLSQ